MPPPTPTRPHAAPRLRLRALGFLGMEGIEHPVLASLVLGDPVLLVGPPGSAKTALARALASSLELKFHAYDAAKSLFEDIIGFPDPASLSKGMVRYVPTPLSVWDKEFVLVDEINRASPATQNKWLELVRARTLMGVPVRGLRHVFAAMNPYGLDGTQPLDEALRDRFAWIIDVPDVSKLDREELSLVARRLSSDDAPLAGPCLEPGRGSPGSAGEAVANVVRRAREKHLPVIERTAGRALARYAAELAVELRTREVLVGGRRLAMLWRNLLAALAVARATRRWDAARPGTPDHAALLEHTGTVTLRSGREDESELQAIRAAAHLAAYQEVFAPARRGGVKASEILGLRRLPDLVSAYEPRRRALRPEEHAQVLTRVLDEATHDDAHRRATGLAQLLRFSRVVASDAAKANVPDDVVTRALGSLREVAGIGTIAPSHVLASLRREPVALDHPAGGLALAATVRAAAANRHASDSMMVGHEAGRQREELQEPLAKALGVTVPSIAGPLDDPEDTSVPDDPDDIPI